MHHIVTVRNLDSSSRTDVEFKMQHPWNNTIRLAVDLEAIGLGGKSGIFQVLTVNHYVINTMSPR